MQTAINIIQNQITLLNKSISENYETIYRLKHEAEVQEATRVKLWDIINDLAKGIHETRTKSVDMEYYRCFFNEGKKIHAIKQYRTDTGAGLKEAKDALEDYFGAHQWSHSPMLGDILAGVIRT